MPCFALGRGQEVLKILLRRKREKELDPSVAHGSTDFDRQFSRVHRTWESEAEGYQEIVDRRERAFAIADCQRPDARAVVVTTSGMLNGGPIVEWADALLRNPRNKLGTAWLSGRGVGGRSPQTTAASAGTPAYQLTLPTRGGRPSCSCRSPIHCARLDCPPMPMQIASSSLHARLVLGTLRWCMASQAHEALENELSRELPDAVVSRPGGQPLRIA